MKSLLKISVILLLLFNNSFANASDLEELIYHDKTRVTLQQIELLKNREIQFQHELTKLQQQKDNFFNEQINKNNLNQAGLDISVAKSNLDSLSIELTESQQAIIRMEKEIQEIENQLNVYGIFGFKVERNVVNFSSLKQELTFQKNLLSIEKNRILHLQKLQTLANSVLEFYKSKYNYLEMMLQSQTIIQLRQQQAKSEVIFQQQQSYWLKQLNILYIQLDQVGPTHKEEYNILENQIFYANENVNLTYLKMMTARYHEQLQQLKISTAHSSTITLLDKANDQVQSLGKQLNRITDLLKTRIEILNKRQLLLLHAKEYNPLYLSGLKTLDEQYKSAIHEIDELKQQSSAFRISLDQALQQELSRRQGLPGLNAKGWLDLGAELLLVPPLTYQVIKNLAIHSLKSFKVTGVSSWVWLFMLEMSWFAAFYFLRIFLANRVKRLPDHEFGHINLTWLLIKVVHRNILGLTLMTNLIWFFCFFGIPFQHFSFLIKFGFVCLFFKMILNAFRLCLVETVHDHAGHDVRLYHRLKWSFLIGWVVTVFTVFIQQLPIIFELKDLFVRFFLFFLFVISVFLLRSWEVLPTLILPHVDDRHTYVKKVIRLLCLLIPCILMINSVIGLFGFVNLVLTISWYESVYLLVLVGYLFTRGMINDVMYHASQLIIRHVSNGWLWTEVILKPFDKILRVAVFISAWVILFLCYGWDKQSPMVRFLNYILNYRLLDILNTSITLLSVLELFVIGSIFFWAARWTREFVYRFLLSRTTDLGIRNTVAILSQYSLIVIGLFICLRVLGIDFRALTVVAGMLGLGIGLGLRDLANNFVCGFLLLFERPLRVGDTVTLGGYEGEVIHIGGRAVTVRTWDHMDVLVPNAEVFSKSFINWTVKDNIVRSVITIKINQQDQPQAIQSVIYAVLASQKNVLKEPAPEVFLTELNNGLIEFEIRYYVNLRHIKSRIGVRSEVLVAIWEAFEREGIKPPYPHHEIYLQGRLPLPFSEKTVSALAAERQSN